MNSRFFHWLLSGILFSSASFCLGAPAISKSTLEFQSGGKRIVMDRFAPAAPKYKSAILVLHGAGGMIFDAPEMRRVAERLTEDGHTTYLIHYFDRTGTIFGLDSNMQKNFDAWLETIRNAVTAVQRDQGNSQPVGIFGYSLGGFLSLAAASNNPNVEAVAELAGGVWNNKESRVEKMPPVIVFHGKRDRRVPFEKYAKPLVKLLHERGGKVETKFFPHEGHVFLAKAMAQVREETARFFRPYLR